MTNKKNNVHNIYQTYPAYFGHDNESQQRVKADLSCNKFERENYTLPIAFSITMCR